MEALRVTIENEDVGYFTVDLIVDDNPQVVGNDWRLGFHRNHKGELYPFILKRSKRRFGYEIDFGSGYANADEYWATDLFDVKIKEGSDVAIWDQNHVQYLGKIKNIKIMVS